MTSSSKSNKPAVTSSTVVDEKKSPSQASQENKGLTARGKDVVVVHGVTDDKKGLKVLRAREQSVELGEVRPVTEGQAINSDLVRLHPRAEAPFICDVETQYAPPRISQEPKRAKSGPAQVATQAYRENWDAIWAQKVTAPGSNELN